MAKLLVIGASRGIGLETVKQALSAGHQVRAFSRSADKIAIENPDLEKWPGDAASYADMSAAIAHTDVVIEAIGVPLNPETIIHGTNLYSKSARIIIDCMHAAGPKRLIAVTGLGAGEARDHLGPAVGLAFQFSLKRIYDDKDVEEQMIKASNLEWTIVRPGLLRDGAMTGLYQVLTDPKTWRVGPIRRADVAHFIVTEAETGTYIGKTPLLIA